MMTLVIIDVHVAVLTYEYEIHLQSRFVKLKIKYLQHSRAIQTPTTHCKPKAYAPHSSDIKHTRQSEDKQNGIMEEKQSGIS